MTQTNFPEGWDEAAFEDDSQVTMVVPKDLVPEIEALLARRRET